MTVKVGLIGCGGMGRAHLERIEKELSGAEIVATADLYLDAAKAAAEPYGAKAYGSGEELISDPNVDAVLIATFGKVHAPTYCAPSRPASTCCARSRSPRPSKTALPSWRPSRRRVRSS